MLAARLVLFVVCFSVYATAQTRTLAVYPGNGVGLDSLTAHHMELELKRLLSPASITIQLRTARAGAEPQLESGPLVTASFRGVCAAEYHQQFSGAMQTQSIADTSISNDRILPYFTVDCGRLVRTLHPMLQPLSVPLRSSMLGRAIGRVFAHEIYHILAQTQDHDTAGVAKEQLSLEDLTADHFSLSPASLRRMTAAWPILQKVPNGSLATLTPAGR